MTKPVRAVLLVLVVIIILFVGLYRVFAPAVASIHSSFVSLLFIFSLVVFGAMTFFYVVRRIKGK